MNDDDLRADGKPYAERPNKTEQKRLLAEIKGLADQLVLLDDSTIAKFELHPKIAPALKEVRGLKPCSARKRLIKYITKLLVKEDLTEVQVYFDKRAGQDAETNRAFHSLERWRDRIIAEGDPALQAFLEDYPGSDRQQLRQSMISAQREKSTGKPVGASKKLFKLLRTATAI